MHLLVYNIIGYARSPYKNRNLFADGCWGFYMRDGRLRVYSHIDEEAPKENVLRVLDEEGQPVSDATVDVYQCNNDLLGPNRKTVDGVSEITETTNADGEVWSDKYPNVFGDRFIVGNRGAYDCDKNVAVVKVKKDSHEEFLIIDSRSLLTQRLRNYVNKTSDAGVIPLVLSGYDQESPNPDKVFSIKSSSDQINIDQRGNLFMNGNALSCLCEWGGSPDSRYVFCTHETSDPFALKITSASRGIILAVDGHHKTPIIIKVIQKLGLRKAARIMIRGILGIIRKTSARPIKILSSQPLK